MSDIITNFVETFATQHNSMGKMKFTQTTTDPIKTQNGYKIVLVHKNVEYYLSVSVSSSSDGNYETTLTCVNSTTQFFKQIQSCQYFIGEAAYKLSDFITETFNVIDENEKKSQADLFADCVETVKQLATKNPNPYNSVFGDVSSWKYNESNCTSEWLDVTFKSAGEFRFRICKDEQTKTSIPHMIMEVEVSSYNNYIPFLKTFLLNYWMADYVVQVISKSQQKST